jgi:hypothetical protein
VAEQWDLPNTGIFYSKDVTSEVYQNVTNLTTVIKTFTLHTRSIHLELQGQKASTFFSFLSF